MMLMLFMVVAAGLSLLIYYAIRVPAILSEVNAWLGQPNPAGDSAAGRAAQVTFLLFVYTAPLALGILVYLLHFVLNGVDRWTRTREEADEAPFRME
ncbi:MAG: hypothetical protein KDA45_06565 [Planctomycetales bacterium]|nr:hypothetical protein [Planctomycetales bacterium]